MVNIFRNSVDSEKYFIVTYDLASETNLRDAAWNLAIGQSVGNPNVRNQWESDELFENNSCMVLGDEEELKSINNGLVKIAFPVINIDFKTDGISHLLVNIMGGQMDIDIIQKCRITNIQFSNQFTSIFNGPNLGLREMRQLCDVDDKTPLFGGIIKPKIGLNVNDYVEVVKIYADNGCNFIKEDEILSNQSFCSIEKRLEYLDL